MLLNREDKTTLAHFGVIMFGSGAGAYPGYVVGFSKVKEEGAYIGNALIMLSFMALGIAISYGLIYTVECLIPQKKQTTSSPTIEPEQLPPPVPQRQLIKQSRATQNNTTVYNQTHSREPFYQHSTFSHGRSRNSGELSHERAPTGRHQSISYSLTLTTP